jgi:serine phosphatase RsbU (regulator of sigma subunit)
LTEALRRHRRLPSPDLLTAIVDEVRGFSPDEQYDDITLIVAKSTADANLAQPSLPLS